MTGHSNSGLAAPFVAVVMAAGQGTRMRSATPKMLLPVCGSSMAGRVVSAARRAGAADVIVVDGPSRRLEGALDDVLFAVQERPLGTANAVQAAEPFIDPDSTVVVLAGDVPLITAETLRGLVKAHAGQGAAATLATMTLDDPSGYGRIVRDEDGGVLRVVETKVVGDASGDELNIDEVWTGIAVFHAASLFRALPRVQPANAQGEYYLLDVVPLILEDGGRVTAHEVADPSEVLGVNDPVQLAEVAAIAQRRIQLELMRSGVIIDQPSSTWVDAGVSVGAGTILRPGTQLFGGTIIGAEAMIGPGAILINTVVGDGATIVCAYLEDSEIGAGVDVSPDGLLPPGAVILLRSATEDPSR